MIKPLKISANLCHHLAALHTCYSSSSLQLVSVHDEKRDRIEQRIQQEDHCQWTTDKLPMVGIDAVEEVDELVGAQRGSANSEHNDLEESDA